MKYPRTITVHRYKYSQERMRNILRKMSKQGYLIFKGAVKDTIFYQCDNKESFEELKNRTKTKWGIDGFLHNNRKRTKRGSI